MLGSNCGGVKPTGAAGSASLVADWAFSSAIALIGRYVTADLDGLGAEKEETDCFQRAAVFGPEIDEVKREAWDAMAIEKLD